jgi:hypothetical protein
VEAVTVGAIMLTMAAVTVTVGAATVTVAVTVGAVTLTVGTAAAVKFGLRLHRRAVTTAGVAAVGMAAVTMVGNFWIKSSLP